MVLDTLLFLEKTLHIATVLVDIPYPLRSTDEIIIAVEETLQKEDTVRMCIFSHISSMVCWIFALHDCFYLLIVAPFV